MGADQRHDRWMQMQQQHKGLRFSIQKSAPLIAPRLPSFGISPSQPEKPQGKSLFSDVSHLDSGVQLSGLHNIGFNTVVETFLQGSKVQLPELRLRIVKTFVSPSKKENRRLCQTANLALSVNTDFQYKRRMTLESTMGTKEDDHTLSCALSSDFVSQLALGLATSHRWGKSLTLFSRYSRDDYAGERFILQAIYELNVRNRVSTLYAATVGHPPQAGFSWIHGLSSEGGTADSLTLKALGSRDGAFSVSIKVQVGSVD